MSKRAYKISYEALNDIEEIWYYTYQNWSIDQADRYYDLLLNEIEYLSTYPQSGKSVDYIRDGYRVSSKISFDFL
jgi:toxin ParE1/3/4